MPLNHLKPLCGFTNSGIRGKRHQTARLFYSWFVGMLTDEYDVINSCYKEEGVCVSPWHLKLRRRHRYAAQVHRMVKGPEMTPPEAVIAYGLPLSAVYAVNKGKNYRYLTEKLQQQQQQLPLASIETPQLQKLFSDGK